MAVRFTKEPKVKNKIFSLVYETIKLSQASSNKFQICVYQKFNPAFQIFQKLRHLCTHFSANINPVASGTVKLIYLLKVC